ncbi:MAG: bifunctional DNA-formamidopyrimidine glycosylase/DNA-(apurinic or apyrimidinic site) lyase [Flexilinea sp.]
MPELPEVETFVRSLNQGGMTGEPILNRQIKSADLFWNRTLAFSDADEGFLAWFVGKTVTNITRRGKFIVLSIPPKFMLIHLRMSGDIRVEREENLPHQKHDRFLLHFSDGFRMAFNDTRKFGRIWLTDSPEVFLQKLGIEPLSPSFTACWFAEHLKMKKTLIKALLLDQSFIAGLGNIYTDEALFLAGINPRRRACDLTGTEIEKLTESIKTVLRTGIKQNGASIDWVYRGGNFQNHFQVYHRTGKPCTVCGTLIEKISINQRATHYCPNCQK